MNNKIELKIIGTIVITIVLSVFVIFTRPEKASSDVMHDWFWVNKTHFINNNTVLFLGDSRIYRGISTQSVNRILPSHKVINLGYSSGGLNNQVFQFALTKVDQSSSVKIIVLGITPFSLTKEARKNEHLLQEINRPLAEIIERKFINPYLTYFEPINITDYMTSEDKPKYYQQYNKRGWVESYKIPADVEEALSSYKKTFAETELSDQSIEETLRFVATMNKKGIQVYGFRPPSSKAMEQLENEFSGFNEKLFRNKFEKASGIWIEIPNRYSFNSYDGSHLHYQSANKLSVYLAKRINQ